MQAFRNWLGADSVNFQAISDSLRDLPQQILGSNIGLPRDQAGIRRGRITGDNTFHFELHFEPFEPCSEGGALNQTGVLVATACAKSSGGHPVPITCTWSRRIGTHMVEIPGRNGSMYHTSADDIGMDIVCRAGPPQGMAIDGCSGTATGVLGPFELDPITRINLKNLISSGHGRFPVRHYRDPDDPHPRDLQICVTQDSVKVIHPGADGGGREVSSSYTADYPKVIIDPLDTLKFRLELGREQDKIYRFVALSRFSRDLITLLIRCFHSRRYVASSFILSRLFQNPATPGAPLTSVSPENFDVHQLLDRLPKELGRTVGQLEIAEKRLERSHCEKRELQSQLRETIVSYTEAIERVHQQLDCIKGGPAATLQLQLHDARALHSKLQLELQEVRQQLTDEQHNAIMGAVALTSGSGGLALVGDAAEVEALRDEIAQLKMSIGAITGDASANSQRDHSRSEELRRFRQDVDALIGEKEGLEQAVQQAEIEKQELVNNFRYVKSHLDKLQMQSLNAPPPSAEAELGLCRLRSGYNQAVEERSRLVSRLDQVEQDREKQKTQHEQARERVMAANAQLLEDIDRLEKETERAAELYRRTVDALGGGSDTMNTLGGDVPATLESLRAELMEKKERLVKRSEETETLRSRLRKLAMV